MTGSSTLRIWVLSDGAAGHMTGSRGLVKAFSKIQDTDVTWINVKLRLPGAHRFLTHALNATAGPWSDFWTSLFYDIETLPDGQPDIIISAGRKTQFLSVLWARKYNAKNFFIGTLRRLPPRHFTAFLTPLPIEADNHIYLDVPLTDVDQDALANAEIAPQTDGVSGPIWALLIGGRTPGYHFDKSDWLNLARAMKTLNAQYGGKWLMTTSRRTGSEVETILRENVPHDAILDAVWYGDNPRKVVKIFFASSDAMFCTEDSMAMLGEAVAAGKPVYSLRPQSTKLDWKETHVISHLEAGKKIYRLPITELVTAHPKLPAVDNFDLFKTSPLEAVSEELGKFLTQ